MTLSIERLREVLNYEPETGVFTWRIAMPPRGMAGARAGTIQKNGYRAICINGFRAYAHRLAWFYVTGQWPSKHIDHRNGVHDDNRISNLREASRSQNLANQKLRSTSLSGFKGVSKKRNSWQARLNVQGKQRVLGCFATPELAHQAYVDAAQKHFGEFARAA